MRVLHRLGEIAYRRAIGQHHMDIDAQPLGMQPTRIGDAMRAIQRVMRGLCVQHHATLGLDHFARSQQQVKDVVILDPAPADFNLNLRYLARQPCARAPDPDRLHRGICHFLGPLDRVAHSISSRVHVGDIAPLDPLRRAVARAQHHHFTRFRTASDDRRNAERADIDSGKDARNAGARHQFASLLAVCLAFALVAATLAAALAVSSARPGTRI